jgi:D-3-phosphoglycerate dehydrogenase / 2-oxoglutarate reductase
MAGRVLITDHVHADIAAALEGMGYEVSSMPDITNEALIQIVGEYSGLIISTKTRIDRRLIDAAVKLRFVGRVGSGMEHVDMAYCAEKGIMCFSSPEGNANAVGEHCLGLLLSVMNNISRSNRELIAGEWHRESNRGEELAGKTIGIIGFGHTGPAFARKLKGFDVRILVYDKYRDIAGTDGLEITDILSICRDADIISFHVPHTAETHHWISKAFLAQCAKDIILLNTSRGDIANTPDLLWGLQTGKLKGLGIDVFEDEPIDKGVCHSSSVYKELLTHPHVVATPHIAGWTHQSKTLLASVLIDKIRHWHNEQ